MNFFERNYSAKLTTWQYEQTIIKQGKDYKVSGISKLISKWHFIKFSLYFGVLGIFSIVFFYLLHFLEGPLREVFSYKLFTDNSTVSNIDLGKLGGERLTTAVIDGNSLVSYLRDPVTQEIDMIANRTILPSKNFSK